MNVFEHLLYSNKDRLLESNLTTVIYNGKPLIKYLDNNANLIKLSSGYKIKDVMFYMSKNDIPKFDYIDFIKHIKIYKKYPQLCLRCGSTLYLIDSLIKHIELYKYCLEVPISLFGIKYAPEKRTIKYVNKFTSKEHTETKDYNCYDSKNVTNLLVLDDYDWAINTNWSDYETLIKELAQ